LVKFIKNKPLCT